jgi:DNA polymerase-3 subunit delta'
MSKDKDFGFQRILGQGPAIRQLRQGFLSNRISHAYLFTGPEGVGKETAAMALAAALNCLYPKSGEACNECRNCLRLHSGNYPDFYHIQPKGSSIKIEQIRSIQEKLSFASFEGNYRIILMHDADKMTEEAANSFLKLLEEPPPAIVFILLTSMPAAILPTILSRCVEVRFLASASQTVNPETDAKKLKAIKIIKALKNAGVPELFSLAAAMEKEEDLEEVLDGIVWLCRDLLISQFKGLDRLILKKDYLDDWDKIPSADALIDTIIEITALSQLLRSNINKGLVLENILLTLQEKVK